MTSIAVKIYDLQNAISTRIHHTWGIREDPQGRHHLLDTEHSLYQILGAYHLYGFAPTFLLALNVLGFHPFARLSSDFHAVHKAP